MDVIRHIINIDSSHEVDAMNKMTAKYLAVLDYIRRKRSATVAEIAAVNFLSESTVRRLLAEMDHEGLVQRFHGGAVISGENPEVIRVVQRTAVNIREKAAIAREAASAVQDGMTLLMLGGTSVMAMCPYLRGKNVTVITNSIPVMNDFTQEEKIKLILLGGVFNPAELEVRGSMTIEGVSRLRADILFTGASYVHPEFGIMTNDPEAVATYQACIAVADRKVLLADSTKFRIGGVTAVTDLSKLDRIITDEQLSADTATNLSRKGIAITTVQI